jgi:hypothetical protein
MYVNFVSCGVSVFMKIGTLCLRKLDFRNENRLAWVAGECRSGRSEDFHFCSGMRCSAV